MEPVVCVVPDVRTVKAVNRRFLSLVNISRYRLRGDFHLLPAD